MSDVSPEVAPAAPAPVEGVPAPAEEAPEAPAEAPAEASEPESFVEEVKAEIVDIFEAAARLVDLVEQHRTIGDGEVFSAVADVKAALPPKPQA